MISAASVSLTVPVARPSQCVCSLSPAVILAPTPAKFASKSVTKWPAAWARKACRQSVVASVSASDDIDKRTLELDSLREELAKSAARAGAALQSCQRLREKLQKLPQAGGDPGVDNVLANETMLVQRAKLEETLKKRMERAGVFLQLTELLKKKVSVQETELIALLAAAGEIRPAGAVEDKGKGRSRATDLKPWTSESEVNDLFLDLERDLLRSTMAAPQPLPRGAPSTVPGPAKQAPPRQVQASSSDEAQKDGSSTPPQGGTGLPRDKLLVALRETEELLSTVSAKQTMYEARARAALEVREGRAGAASQVAGDGSDGDKGEDFDAPHSKVQQAQAMVADVQAARSRLQDQLAAMSTDIPASGPETTAGRGPDTDNTATSHQQVAGSLSGQDAHCDGGTAGPAEEDGDRSRLAGDEGLSSGGRRVAGDGDVDGVDLMDTVARRREFKRRMEEQGDSGAVSPTAAAAEAAKLVRELLSARLQGKDVTLGDIIGLCESCDELAVATVTLSDPLDARWLYQRALKLSFAVLDVDAPGSLPDSYRGCIRLLVRLGALLSRYLPRPSADEDRAKMAAAELYKACKEFAVSARREEWLRAEADLRRVIFALCLLPAEQVPRGTQHEQEILAPYVLLVKDIVNGEPGLASLRLGQVEDDSTGSADGETAVDRLRRFLES